MPISLGGANSARGNPKGILQGRYHLADEIGRGASGIVHKALNLQTGAFVAGQPRATPGVEGVVVDLFLRELDDVRKKDQLRGMGVGMRGCGIKASSFLHQAEPPVTRGARHGKGSCARMTIA